jgi:multiple antibiotic resistance protein
MIMRAFYPLTLPLTVDPGAISVAVTIGANHAHGVERVVIAFLAGITGTAIISASVWLAYRYAPRVAKWLGHTRVMVVLRLSAFIVLCIGVEITFNGVRSLASEIAFAPPTRRRRRRPKPSAEELRGIVQGVLLAVAALIPIVNPLGTAPLFLA